jgi:hypothetical protein
MAWEVIIEPEPWILITATQQARMLQLFPSIQSAA